MTPTPSPEAVKAAEYVYDGMQDHRFNSGEFVRAFAPTIDDEFATLRSRLAEAEGYLLGLTVDDAMWPNHKDCICGECELLREIRAFLAAHKDKEAENAK